MATPSSGSGGIMKFAKVKLGCMSCKAPLASRETSLCGNCKAMVRGTALACLSVTKPDMHNLDSCHCWLGPDAAFRACLLWLAVHCCSVIQLSSAWQ